jgi:hypothetical protein
VTAKSLHNTEIRSPVIGLRPGIIGASFRDAGKRIHNIGSRCRVTARWIRNTGKRIAVT